MTLHNHNTNRLTTTISLIALATVMGNMEARGNDLTLLSTKILTGPAFNTFITVTLGGSTSDTLLLNNHILIIQGTGIDAITNPIKGSGGLFVNEPNNGPTSGTDTFSAAIGEGSPVSLLGIGFDNDKAGSAYFASHVSADSIKVSGGDLTSENSVASFAADVSATSITLAGNNGGTEGDATIRFVGREGSETQTISGQIDGNIADEGQVIVTDLNSESPALVTFSDAIGDTLRIGSLAVGSDTLGGNAAFLSAVTAKAITISGGDAETETGTAQFYGDVTSDGITLNNNNSTASIRFRGVSDQTISGPINGSGGGHGTIHIEAAQGAEVTFKHAIGGVASIRDITIGGTHANAVIFEDTVATDEGITVGSADEDDGPSTALFYKGVESPIILGGSTTYRDSVTFNASKGAFTVTGIISGTDEGSLSAASNAVIIAGSTHRVTFDTATGDDIGTLAIGSSTASGQASFLEHATAVSLVITGGDGADEDSTGIFAGNLTTNTISLAETQDGGSATLQLAGTNDQTIDGTIDANTTDHGTLIVSNGNHEASFVGSIGSSHALHRIDIGSDDAGGSARFASAARATTITVTGSADDDDHASTAVFNADIAAAIVLDDRASGAVVELSGSTPHTLTGSINGVEAGQGTVHITNDTTITGHIGETRLSTLTLQAGKTLTLGSTEHSTLLGAGTITIHGTVHPLGSVILSEGSNLNFAHGSTITIDHPEHFTTTPLFDAHTHQASIIIGTTSSDRVTLLPSHSFTEGSMILLDTRGGTYTKNGDFFITDYGLTQYSLTDHDGIISIQAHTPELSDITRPLGIFGSTDALKALRASIAQNAPLTDAVNAILTSHDSTAIATLLDQSGNTATAMSGVTQAVTSIAQASGNMIEARLVTSGIPSGDPVAEEANTIWTEPFYTSIREHGTPAISGYHATTSGIMMGSDLYYDTRATLGVAFNYANTTVEGDNLANDRTIIDTYLLTLYGIYKAPAWYMNGSVGYGINDVTTQRHMTFAAPHLTASGEYSGRQYQAQIDVGMPVEFLKDRFITPLAGLSYIHLTQDNYTETGAGEQNIHVSPNDLDIVESSVGLKLHARVKTQSGTLLTPQIHANARYEWLGQEAQSTSTYTGGGTAFQISGNPSEQLGGNAGAGITYTLDNIWVSAGYDAEFKNNYLSQTSTVKAGVRF